MTRFSLSFTVIAALGVLPAAVTAQGLPTFHPQDQIATGSVPQSVAMADLDSNGALDLVTANADSDTVSILLSTVPGSFKTPVTFQVAYRPYDVAIGDLNLDGKADIVTANADSNGYSALLGTGTGSFGLPWSAPTGGNWPESVAIGLLNNDGFPDLAFANAFSDTVTVLIGTGAGSFGASTAYAVGSTPRCVVIGDVNQDGLADLVSANETPFTGPGSVSILLGTGTGSFAATPELSVGGLGDTPFSVAIGHLNADGIPDLVTANGNLLGGSVSVLMGTGAGSFATAKTFGVGSFAGSVAIGDFNGDAMSDVVTANGGASMVSVLPGMGTGNFGAPATFGVGNKSYSLAVQDVNGDLKLDIVTANTDSDSVSVLLNASSLTAGNAWTYLGHGLIGSGGQAPTLIGIGSMTANSLNNFCLSNAKPDSYGYFCFGFGTGFHPFFGGVMVPSPFNVYGPFATSQGQVCLPSYKWIWSPGLKFYLQAWIKDAAAPYGFAASNGLQGAGQ